MNKTGPLASYFDRLEAGSTLRWRGRVLQVVGNLIESEGPFCSIGESCEITSAIGLAEQLVSLLLTEARQAQGRPALHVVGRPPAPEKAERLAEVIDFAARRVSGS